MIAGCSSSKTSAAPGKKSLDKVTYITGLGDYGREAYAWYGQAKGYFKAEGIDLTIEPGKAGALNLQEIESGKAQFAAIDYSGAIVDYGKGTDTKFKIVDAINQRTTVAIMTLGSSHITGPADLVNKTVGVQNGAVPKTLFPAYARLAGLTDEQIANVHFQSAQTPAQLPGFLVSKKTQGIGQFVVGVPAINASLKTANVNDTVTTLPYSKYLGDLYGNVLVATNELVKGKPDLVRRFNKAYNKSLAASLDDPDGTADILHKYDPAQPVAAASAEVKLLKPYCGSGAQIGTMDQTKVARGIAILQGAGLFTKTFDPNEMVAFNLVPKPNAA
ncbi:ABC transporter substrate-binding protein [Rugosimonospora acidiphila]|uniref:Thiamine pyrimidine synthase n=1 Tax=Rugosimonospora acidiphila TaxID=556531 RepID=A0ABP9SIB4_9ACTN